MQPVKTVSLRPDTRPVTAVTGSPAARAASSGAGGRGGDERGGKHRDRLPGLALFKPLVSVVSVRVHAAGIGRGCRRSRWMVRPAAARRPPAIQRGVYKNVQALERDIRQWTKLWNADPKPFVWKRSAEEILTPSADIPHEFPAQNIRASTSLNAKSTDFAVPVPQHTRGTRAQQRTG